MTKPKLNLIGIGPIATSIVERMRSEDCLVQTYPDNLAGEDLESNENLFAAIPTPVTEAQYTETYCFVEGKLGISGITLALLSNYKEKPITIIYIKNDILSEYHKKNDEISFNILQEYARSGVFKHFLIFDYNKMLNDILQGVNDDKDPINTIIDRIIFGVHIYWRLGNEKYLEGSQIDFDATIYKISTYFDVIETSKGTLLSSFYEIELSNKSVLVIGVKKQQSREQLTRTMKLKSLARSNKSDVVILEDDNEFAMILKSSHIVQESIYTK